VGSYDRQLHTKAGEVTLTVPKLRSLPFETAIIERYRRRETSVEEALIEMYLAGVSVRRVEDITQAFWGTRVSASTVSDLKQRIYKQIEEWRQQPLVGLIDRSQQFHVGCGVAALKTWPKRRLGAIRPALR
jgi:putative transposase